MFLRKGITDEGLEVAAGPVADGLFSAEKTLLKGLKSIYLALSNFAVKKFGAKLPQEQEILIALADVAIQTFALESAVLRAEKAFNGASEGKKELFEAVVKVCAFSARGKLVSAAQRCAVFVEDESAGLLLDEIEGMARYDASGLLQAKRLLAEATSQAEKYIF
jgi:hypothetical protein